MNPNEFLAECFHHRYASVFFLDRLPIQLDGVRLADDPMADYIDHWHTRDYTALGYRVVRVPVLPPQERLSFTLETLSDRRTPLTTHRSASIFLAVPDSGRRALLLLILTEIPSWLTNTCSGFEKNEN